MATFTEIKTGESFIFLAARRPAGLPHFAPQFNADEERIIDMVERSGRYHPSALRPCNLHFWLMCARAAGAIVPVNGLDADDNRERDLALAKRRAVRTKAKPWTWRPDAASGRKL